MTSESFRKNPMFLRNQFKGDGIFDIPLLQTDEIDLEEIELIGYDKLCDNKTEAIVFPVPQGIILGDCCSKVWSAGQGGQMLETH